MAILEEIAVSVGKPAETKAAILITNGQHQNSPFSGGKYALLDVPAGFADEYLVSGARKRCYDNNFRIREFSLSIVANNITRFIMEWLKIYFSHSDIHIKIEITMAV